jgi:hypothetical protein
MVMLLIEGLAINDVKLVIADQGHNLHRKGLFVASLFSAGNLQRRGVIKEDWPRCMTMPRIRRISGSPFRYHVRETKPPGDAEKNDRLREVPQPASNVL